jgi:hypothetical protein
MVGFHIVRFIHKSNYSLIHKPLVIHTVESNINTIKHPNKGAMLCKKEKCWSGGMAQVVEHLLTKWEALSSRAVAPQKKSTMPT